MSFLQIIDNLKKLIAMPAPATRGLSNLQLELLKVFSVELNETQILEIRAMLTHYFAEKATEEMDRLWDERGWTEQTMKEWANEHIRSKKERK